MRSCMLVPVHKKCGGGHAPKWPEVRLVGMAPPLREGLVFQASVL
eukprot:CAMPEP_0183522154 /NCGR_PEP_ID=MMETSP0371-20130417/18223_1 /TAXON_ID=268820 /ORGANISM="Peridinium aciculiferum, Strain PAER-2" /LENGTH=44 /DNA_ID= /DNA_START= /DNA_END= /DNA_ORIENTATION=